MNIERAVLANDMVLRLAPFHQVPYLVITLALPAGSGREPAAKAGLASLTSSLLERGCAGRDRQQVAEDLDRRGARLAVRQGRDALTLELCVLSEDIDWGFSFVGDMVMRPNLKASEFQKLRQEALGAAHSREEDPRERVNELFSRTLAGEHPYGRPVDGTSTTLREIQHADIESFYQNFYGPQAAVISLAGDLEWERAQQLAQHSFGDWTHQIPPYEAVDPELLTETCLSSQNMPLEQAKIVLGFPSIRRLDPDFYPVLVLNYLFGGAFRSRLTQSIRGRKGLAYAVSSHFTAGRARGAFRIAMQTKNEQANLALHEIFGELELMAGEAVFEEELDEARRGLVLGYPLEVDTCPKIATRALETEYYGLPEDRWTDFREGVEGVTAADVLRVAQRLFRPERAAIAVVADLEKAALEGPQSWVQGAQVKAVCPESVELSHRPLGFPELVVQRHGRVAEAQLDNGMRLLTVESNKAPIASVQVWYAVGSRNEPSGQTGVSHLLEHMMFRGSPKFPDGRFDQLLALHGAGNNAFTTEDYTAYYENLASDAVWLAMELESDRMRALAFSDEDYLKEREVVVEERRLRTEDSPSGLMFEQMQATAFTAHPYRHPVIGWMSDIEQLSADDIRRHHRDFYHPGNATLVICGDVRSEEMLGLAQHYFGSIEPGPPPPQVRTREPKQLGQRRYEVKKHAGYAGKMFGFHVPNLRHEDRFPLELLSSILAEGASSRLTHQLVAEKELLLNAWAYYDPMVFDPTLFYVGAEFTPDKDHREVEEEVWRILNEFSTSPVTQDELDKARRQWEADFVMKQDDVEEMATLLGTYDTVDHWSTLEKDRSVLAQVVPEDVMKVAQLYLQPDKCTVGRLIP